MNPEFLEALRLVEEYDKTRPTLIREHRLYYDEQGAITMYTQDSHPESGNYVVIDNPDIFFKNNTSLLKVVNGELKILTGQPVHYLGLKKSSTGQRVVKGMAAVALTNQEDYQEVEYYDRKTNY